MSDLTPEQQAHILMFVTQQGSIRARIRGQLLAQVRRVTQSLSGRWYDQSAVTEAAGQLELLVDAAQQVTGVTTQAYLDQVFLTMGTSPPENQVSLPSKLRGIDPATEWQRPAKEYRRARLLGVDDLIAQERADRRAQVMAGADLDLAMREAARQRLVDVENVIGYRRIIHPELSRTGTCGLCIAAASRIYHKKDLLPIHDGCMCEVLPVVKGKADPARIINDVDIAEMYQRVLAEAGKTSADALKRTRIQVSEHGELGPVLHSAGHHFRDQAEAFDDLRDAIENVVA